MSDIAILKYLGAQIKQMRLNRNITQAQLGIMAGLSRKAVSDIEKNGKCSMKSLVQILRALEKLEMLNIFETEVEISPIQVAKLRGKYRNRASK
jgi:transcriptional regulator with XRE-family HTH domain